MHSNPPRLKRTYLLREQQSWLLVDWFNAEREKKNAPKAQLATNTNSMVTVEM